MKKSKRIKIVFFIYIIAVIKVIIFKYPWEDLKAIMNTWEKGVILEGLDTANFTLFILIIRICLTVLKIWWGTW